MSARWPLACFAAMGVFWGAWAALLPDIRVQVAASDAELGLALVGAGAGALPAMLLTGRLWTQFGWWLIPLTALTFGAATLTPLLAASPLALGVAMLAIGASSGSLDVAMNSAVSDVEAAQGRRLMYAAHAFFSLAVLVSSVATGLARELGAGPVHVLPVVAAVFIVAAVGSATSARRSALAGIGTPVPAGMPAAGGMPSATGAIVALAVLCALGFLIEDAIQNWSALLLERELGAGPALGGAAPGVFGGAMFVGRSAGQWLGGRVSERDLLVGGALGAAAGLGIVSTAGNELVALAGFAISGAGVALVAPALFARAGRMAQPGRRGAAIATLTVFGYTGFLVGPVIVGLLSEAAGLRVAIACLGVLAIVLAIGGQLVLGGRRTAGFEEGEALLRTSRG
jgi:hypothetical protein